MHRPRHIADLLAAAFMAGPFDSDGMVKRGQRVISTGGEWLRPLARRVAAAYAIHTRPRKSIVAAAIVQDRGFLRAHKEGRIQLTSVLPPPPTMQPIPVARSWDTPAIVNVRDLADWLRITIEELEWFADRWVLQRSQRNEKLRHYRYRTLSKRFAAVRLIEAPKPRLKQFQRAILEDILDQIPPHQAAHGFRRGRSIGSFAAPHVGKAVVLKIDLEDFFPSIRVARIEALFRSVGYSEPVADLLAGLCTNSAPEAVWEREQQKLCLRSLRQSRWLYSQPHLPQGAPTSPALANLCAYRLDCRLAGLAHSTGATYTRYADDLAFSGDEAFARGAERFLAHAAATIMEEGFRVHHRKTRVMRRGVRQRLTGVIVNERLNIPRRDYDNLRATLTNCVRFGAVSQNRDAHTDFRAHLLGRISFVEMVTPSKGARLRALFDRIEW